MKSLLKSAGIGLSVAIVWPLALSAGFGRLRPVFVAWSHVVALCPGIIGDYLRVAFYHLTLRSCSLHSRISFGTFFSTVDASVGKLVYIGSYCVFGRACIGDGTQIASHVQIVSGSRQHGHDEQGRVMSSDQDRFRHVSIGAYSWLGAGAIVMADVGSHTTIGAGAVVTKPIPEGVVAVGNPARVVRSNSTT